MSNGFGLSVCKQICNHLGGEITAKSELGEGTTFTFSMIIQEVSIDERLKDDKKKTKAKN